MKKHTKYLLYTILWLFILITSVVWFFLYQVFDFFEYKNDNNTTNSLAQLIDELNKEKWTNIDFDNKQFKEIIKNNTNTNKINILVVWRWWWTHDAPNLTDTIILMSIDLKKNIVSMLSIPRDLYVEYPDISKNWKINWLYATYKYKNKDWLNWMNILKNKISSITGEKIDFFINVDFKWFIKIVDTIWWVHLTVPERFVDFKYPDWKWWVKSIVFKKWLWLFDWENALKYVRSRHSTSDFDRSNRQQQVIWAIKNKLNSSYFLKSPYQIKKLFDVIKEFVYTDIPLSILLKIWYQLNNKWDFKILSSNLNNSCTIWVNSCQKWGFLYNPQRSLFWWMSFLLADWTDIQRLNNYSKVRKYINLVINYQELYDENYQINIFNSTKINWIAAKLSNDIIKYWFNIPEKDSIWNIQNDITKSIIYFNNIPENSITIKIIKTLFKWKVIKTSYPIYSNNNSKIEVIIWEDFVWDDSPFLF